MTANRPDWAIQVAFNADPNDPNAVPVWVDQAANVMSAGAISRGKQYELAQSQTAQPTVTIRDINEYMNPANTLSPYYPNVQPYRQIVWQGVWPNAGTGNLINTNMWLYRIDPTFESYATPNANPGFWLLGVGSVTPIIANARS